MTPLRRAYCDALKALDNSMRSMELQRDVPGVYQGLQHFNDRSEHKDIMFLLDTAIMESKRAGR